MQKQYDRMQYDPMRSAQEAQELWNGQDIYRFQADPGRQSYIIDTPPPTVSGSLHIGHIFSYTHQDVVARYWRMRGYDVLYPFGFDDNGLPTERFVEKKLGINPLQVGRSAFIQAIIQETRAAQDQFKHLWTRMGLSVDWSARYSTIDRRTQRISQSSFIDLYTQGDVYRSHRAAPYCTTCYTSVAQAELEDLMMPGQYIQLGFADAHDPRNELVIATTRPEFLASCVAVLVHPDDTRYTRWIGARVRVPVYGHEVPVIADPDVKPDKGTGAVMCCAFGDTLDITWIERHQLAYRQILGTNGRFASDIPYIGDLKVKPAREQIITLLQQGLIRSRESISHAVHVHERCKQPVEYLYLRQWFVAITKHKQELEGVVSQIAWHPEYMRVRCLEWIEHLQWDWCISRQRFYGIPFPCWHCVSCGLVIMAAKDQLPIDPQETPYEGACPTCGCTDIVPDTDVMDTWNTSSLTPYIVQEIAQERAGNAHQVGLPLSVRPQAHDIIRTWAFYTLAKSWLHDKTIPWTNIMISGHVLSGAHEKISKSQGNSPLDPERLLATYSADAIRYWACCAQLGTDTAFSENQLKIGTKLVTKLWNACIFVHEHGRASSIAQLVCHDPLNIWVVGRFVQMTNMYDRASEHFEFHQALYRLEQFFWGDWCDTYLELIKDRFFTPERYESSVVQETRSVLYGIGFALIQRYAPYVPFITEAIYQHLYRDFVQSVSVHTTTYVDIPDVAHTDLVQESMVLVLDVIQQVRKIKSEAQLSLKTDLAELTVYTSTADQLLLKPLYATIQGASRAERLVFLPLEPGVDQSRLQTHADGLLYGYVVLQERV